MTKDYCINRNEDNKIGMQAKEKRNNVCNGDKEMKSGDNIEAITGYVLPRTSK